MWTYFGWLLIFFLFSSRLLSITIFVFYLSFGLFHSFSLFLFQLFLSVSHFPSPYFWCLLASMSVACVSVCAWKFLCKITIIEYFSCRGFLSPLLQYHIVSFCVCLFFKRYTLTRTPHTYTFTCILYKKNSSKKVNNTRKMIENYVKRLPHNKNYGKKRERKKQDRETQWESEETDVWASKIGRQRRKSEITKNIFVVWYVIFWCV